MSTVVTPVVHLTDYRLSLIQLKPDNQQIHARFRRIGTRTDLLNWPPSCDLCASNGPGDTMFQGRKAVLLTIVASFGGLVAIFFGITLFRNYQMRPILLKGAVIKQDDDPNKQSPIMDVEISEANGLATSSTKSNFMGYFTIPLLRGVGRDQSVTLRFLHPDYVPSDLTELVSDKLTIIHLVPIRKDTPEEAAQPNHPAIAIANVRIRYSTEAITQENIGTGVKTFQIQNVGNIPCQNGTPCSPDGKWKASINSESLDAGEGSVFRNARVSCIAGPCPFTKIDNDGYSAGGRYIKVSVRNWSDTATFLFQAEVFRPQISDIVRMTFPIILGTSLDFTLPPGAEGPSVEAEINGEDIIFPLGPIPVLSWADCNVSVAKDKAKFYRCEVNNGYRFR